ncbi:MAG TPA: PP2C family protein-serine/threonine phosphatase [Mycobacteriales bacterium]|nr:PP2C family protein-serine/threonine phosphatase [Mycobacteriales bacterium]
MNRDVDAEEQRRLLQLSAERTGLPLEQLWLRYFALGGSCGLVEVEAHVLGMMTLPASDCDMLAHAANERLDEMDREARIPYLRRLRSDPGRHDPGVTLVELLRDARSATPDQLGQIAADAGRSLDLDVAVYLVDHDQTVLVPVPSSTSVGREVLDVDATFAGRVYRSGQALPRHTGSDAHLWVPLRDGVDRLGVLDITVKDPLELDDPGLRDQATWLASLLSALIISLNALGDGIELVRRQRPRSAAAELLWQLLPPATAGIENVQLAAWIAPADTVGGDAYDYEFAQDSVTFAIYDAMGHGLGAGLIAAAALAASRSARRNGADLQEQLGAADLVVAEQFGGSTFLTAFVGKLDLQTGVLRYIRAGHAPALVLRQGKVVTSLGGGARLPIGLLLRDHPNARAGRLRLQPGDWLILNTDGVIEARDAEGAFFGEPRLIDFLTREIASGHPPPETVRRLAQAVMNHQQGSLQDDATIVLIEWSGPREQPWEEPLSAPA